jgi:tetratricopeptide (TPR) repeat protein
MSKYNIDLDYVIRGIDISRDELEEIKAEADKIISENKESNENLAVAYLKKAQCIRKHESWKTVGFILYEEGGFLYYEENGIKIEEEDVKKLLERALELSPDMPEALMQLGFLNNYTISVIFDCQDEIINFFNKAIQLKPDYAAAYNNRAMVFYKTTIDMEGKDNSEEDKINFRNAISDLTEAIRLRPFDALYHLNRGVFHSRLDEHKEAIEDFSSAINYASDKLKEELKTDVMIFNLRGKEYLELEDYGKAIDDFSESLRLMEHIFEPKENDKAEEDFSKSQSLDRYADTLLLRGKAFYLAGEKDKANPDFKEYINIKRKLADDEVRNEINHLIGVKLEDI